MKIPDLVPEEIFDRDVFRNIFTIIDSQSIFDDLDVSESEFSVLYAWDNESSQIDHTEPQKNRAFQYRDHTATSMAVFSEVNWPKSRFTDGTFGVWYGAIEKDTSVLETLYWCLWFAREDIKESSSPVINERAMFVANVKTERSVDLRGHVSQFPDLVSPSDYTLCQKIGSVCHKSGIDVLQTQSVRNPGGVCVPVFNPRAIVAERKLGFLRYELRWNGDAIVSTIDNRTISIPESWGFR